MTPGARVAAAAEIVDRIAAGAAVESALLAWSRGSRFAGSKDRRAVRDLVFGVVRRWWSSAWTGGGETGRARLLGAMILDGVDPAQVFTGEGHAPEALTDAERGATRDPSQAPDAVRADLQPWVLDLLRAAHGADQALAIGAALRERAAVHLRVNLVRATPDQAIRALRADGIETVPHPLAATAIEVVRGATQVARSLAFASGMVELQDAASQAVIEALGPLDGVRVLDFCAGGGGKSLAMAAKGARVVAHDIDPARMGDIPQRAARAGVGDRIALEAAPQGRFELVLADAPCSGSGAWRRQPGAKLNLTPERLAELNAMQDRVIEDAAARVAPGGRLAYATCSLLDDENGARIARFLERQSGWEAVDTRLWTPLDGADGFFLAVLRRV